VFQKIKNFFEVSLPAHDQKIWLIVFMPRNQIDMWTLFTWHRKNFDHCLALRYDPVAAVWLHVEWSSHGLYCEPITQTEVDLILARCVMDNWPCLKYHTKVYYHMPIFGYYCVNVIKHLVGLKSWSVTPYQLYCALKKRGATEILV
jgi:hypothetical protein